MNHIDREEAKHSPGQIHTSDLTILDFHHRDGPHAACSENMQHFILLQHILVLFSQDILVEGFRFVRHSLRNQYALFGSKLLDLNDRLSLVASDVCSMKHLRKLAGPGEEECCGKGRKREGGGSSTWTDFIPDWIQDPTVEH